MTEAVTTSRIKFMGNSMTENKRVRIILEQLEEVRGNLLDLSDDIWLNIDHNDNDELRKGSEFKQEYNDAIQKFEDAASNLKKVVEEYTGVDVSNVDVQSTKQSDSVQQASDEKDIKDLNPNNAHSLTESFTYKRPTAIDIQGRVYRNVRTWKQVYGVVGRHLAENNSNKIAKLPDSGIAVTKQGNPLFAKAQADLREALKFTSGVYAEANLSANYIRDNIRAILKFMHIPEDEVRVYLRQDRGRGPISLEDLIGDD